MRILTSRLLVATIVLLLLAASCQASVSTSHQSHDFFEAAPSSHHLQKRVDEETVASAWSKAQVPERLRNWKIFQDGGGFRETIRKGYIGFLRKLDKLHEPYPEFRHIKKEWIYEKDLRQHYVLPRVLRIPAITQETAIPNLKPFVAALKDADSELKLNTEARERVPTLSEHLDEKEAEATAADSDAPPSNRNNAGTDTSQDISGSPQRGSRRRRPRRFNRKNSFQQFRPAEPVPEQPPLSQASSLQRSEILSESSSARASLDHPERAATPVQDETNADQEADKHPSAMRGFRDSIMKFQDRFERIKKFRDDQIGKASLHYQAPTQAFAPHSVLSPEEIGLSPVRLPTIRSGDSSLEPTPRVDDGKGNEADVSNSVSPAFATVTPLDILQACIGPARSSRNGTARRIPLHRFLPTTAPRRDMADVRALKPQESLVCRTTTPRFSMRLVSGMGLFKGRRIPPMHPSSRSGGEAKGPAQAVTLRPRAAWEKCRLLGRPSRGCKRRRISTISAMLSMMDLRRQASAHRGHRSAMRKRSLPGPFHPSSSRRWMLRQTRGYETLPLAGGRGPKISPAQRLLDP